jgi:hypothetical protein
MSAGAASSYRHIDSVSSLQELKECISEVERIDDRDNRRKKRSGLTIKEEEQQQQEEKQEVSATTLERVILLRTTHIFQIENISSFLSFSHCFLFLCSQKG